MAKKSAGILMYRYRNNLLEVLLVHPGGPFWSKKDLCSWSIPKGEYEDYEDAFTVARRELLEETGFVVEGEFIELTPIKQPSGKVVSVWAVKWNCDAASAKSNCFIMEWPKKSGIMEEFPEIDRADWFPVTVARGKMLKGQVPFLDQLCKIVGS
jgi:predicted NUDIX family NTP pyrophosphohydrolase